MDVGDGSSFDPLRELVDGHQQVCVPTCCPLERTYEVEAPYCEWPSDGDHLQSMGWEVGLLGAELAPMA